MHLDARDSDSDGLSRSMVRRVRNAPRGPSMKSPKRNRDKPSVQTSSLLPCDSLTPYTAAEVPQEIEDTTLYLVAPSCVDLTAFASGVISTLLSSSSELYKATIPAISAVELAPWQSAVVDVPSMSRSRDIMNHIFFECWPLDDPQNSDNSIPAIPSILFPTNGMEACDLPCISSPRPHHAPSILSYDILGTIGKGIYGKVVLACLKDDFEGELYAVKVVRKQSSHEFETELAILQLISNLSGSNEVNGGLRFLQRLREIFRDEKALFIVLEYHPATLSDPEIASRFRIRNDGQTRLISLPPTLIEDSTSPGDEAVNCLRFLIAEISLGLAFLHDRGLVHQDIKPANVMISFAGHVVIGEFGAATKLPLLHGSGNTVSPGDEFGMPIRRYGSIVLQAEDFVTFTPLYAAPELREQNSVGLVVYDERCDWWSLGVLLYELVTGSVPFHYRRDIDATRQGCRGGGDRSLSFEELDGLLGPAKVASCAWYACLEDLLRSLLTQDPNDRLAWPQIKDHPFLVPLRELWSDIANLKFQPCPNPPTFYITDDSGSVVLEEYQGKPCPSWSDKSCSAPQGSHFAGEQPEESVMRPDISLDDPFRSSLQISLVPTWHPPTFQGDMDSDEGSILQPMPSSASLWWGVVSSQEPHDDSDIDALVPISENSDTDDDCSIQPLQSPFSLTAVLRHPRRDSGSCDFQHLTLPKTSVDPPTVYTDQEVPERITISLLEAMDDRDRLVIQEDRRVCKKRLFRREPFRRVWNKLFSW